MHPTLRRTASHVHKPLIRFLGKRQHPSTPDVPHPHPAAPLEFKQSFSEFVARREAAAHSSPSPSASAAPADSKKGSNNDTVTYHDFWEAPNRLWQRTYSEQEMNAIMSGGASNY